MLELATTIEVDRVSFPHNSKRKQARNHCIANTNIIELISSTPKMMTTPNNNIENQVLKETTVDSSTMKIDTQSNILQPHELQPSQIPLHSNIEQSFTQETPSNYSCGSSSSSEDDEEIEDEEQKYRTALDSLGPYDVICGRGSLAFNNIGNRRFRILIGLNVDRYSMADGRHRKGQFIGKMVHEIVNEIGAKFYKFQKGQLKELSGSQIRQKVGHALRDTLAFQESQQQLQQQKQQEKQRQNQNQRKEERNTHEQKGNNNPVGNNDRESLITKPRPSMAFSFMQSHHANNAYQRHQVPPPVPPPSSFSDNMFHGPIQSFDVPVPSNNTRDFRASVLDANNLSSKIDSDNFFPISTRDQKQQQKQHQQHQHQERSSRNEFEEWLWGKNNSSNERKRLVNNNYKMMNPDDSKNTTKEDNEIGDDPFEDIDFIPVPIGDLIQEQHDTSDVRQV